LDVAQLFRIFQSVLEGLFTNRVSVEKNKKKKILSSETFQRFGKKYDPEGVYIKKYLPFLKNYPAKVMSFCF
jgi:hypothetical protein